MCVCVGGGLKENISKREVFKYSGYILFILFLQFSNKLVIGVGRFRILGGPRFRILGGPRGGQIPSRHMTS